MLKNKVFTYSGFINEGYWNRSQLNDQGKVLLDAFLTGDYPSARDLRNGLGITIQRIDGQKIRLEKRRESIPKTWIYMDENGNYCSEHYSSKMGIYGKASFDTPQELFRHVWLRIVKNGIPTSLVSKRTVNEKVDFDKTFPAGEQITMDDIRERLKPFMGGEQLANPSNLQLIELATVKRLISLGLIGKEKKASPQSIPIVVRDISKGGKIKYFFYIKALGRVKELYGDIIDQILRSSSINVALNHDYEAWTVTNSQLMPVNSVNFRTGESILRCRLEDNEMFNAVFIAIVKRTFRRATGKAEHDKLIRPKWGISQEKEKIVNELNDLLAEYFYNAAAEVSQTVFLDREHDNTPVHNNAKALLVKYILENGSTELKTLINENLNLQKYIDIVTKFKDIDSLTKRLINVANALKYV